MHRGLGIPLPPIAENPGRACLVIIRFEKRIKDALGIQAIVKAGYSRGPSCQCSEETICEDWPCNTRSACVRTYVAISLTLLLTCEIESGSATESSVYFWSFWGYALWSIAYAKGDLRLLFSVLDPFVGNMLSVFWGWQMVADMGNALEILAKKPVTHVEESALQAAVTTTLNPDQARPLSIVLAQPLDHACAAGLMLADVLIERSLGVRSIDLINAQLSSEACTNAAPKCKRSLIKEVLVNRIRFLGSQQVG
ncbi:hypothetical protein BDV93DRAFT_509510 [Ceratobasidium sp. AG-I]|nr:hypothetical protein BDV93DRAFT_509510 [Ceratobasidium sp. AG-I]